VDFLFFFGEFVYSCLESSCIVPCTRSQIYTRPLVLFNFVGKTCK